MFPDMKDNWSAERWLDSVADEFDRIARAMGDDFHAAEMATRLRRQSVRAARLGNAMWILALIGLIWWFSAWPAVLQSTLSACVAILCKLRARTYRRRADYYDTLIRHFTGSLQPQQSSLPTDTAPSPLHPRPAAGGETTGAEPKKKQL